MKFHLTFAILLVLQFNTIMTFAQASSVTSGQDARGLGGEVSWSIGQVSYSTNIGTTGLVSQGVQQPFEIYVITSVDDDISSSVRAYPNPVTNNLILHFESSLIGNEKWHLLSFDGLVLYESVINESLTKINMEAIPAGIYFLKIFSNEEIIKHFKLIKQN